MRSSISQSANSEQKIGRPQIQAEAEPNFKEFPYFRQFQLRWNDLSQLNQIPHPSNSHKKIKAIVEGIMKRNRAVLYRGDKYCHKDFQTVLDLYPQIAPSILKGFHISVNKSQDRVLIQCHNCGKYTEVWKYCPICEHVHYCHEGCEMQSKFTHEKQECTIKLYPNTLKALEVEIHIGSDIGQNVYVGFQHYVGLGMKIRGNKLLQAIITAFEKEGEFKLSCEGFHVEYKPQSHPMLKFINQIKSYQQSGSDMNVKVDSFDNIAKLYEDNSVLRHLQLFLLENGAVQTKTIKEIHDNHFRKIYVFNYPF